MIRIRIGVDEGVDDYGVGFGYKEKRRGRTRKKGGVPQISVETSAIVQLPERFDFAAVATMHVAGKSDRVALPYTQDEDGTLRASIVVHDDEGDPTLTAEERAKHSFDVEIVQPAGLDGARDRVILIAKTKCHSVADAYDRGRGRRVALRRVLTGLKQLLPEVYIANGERRSTLAKTFWHTYFDCTRDGVEFGMRSAFPKTEKKEAAPAAE